MNDRTIFEGTPLPIARGFRRFRNAEEVRERHDAAYYLYEIYLKYVASMAIARYLASEERDHRVNAALKGLVRPSLGEWVRFLRECLRFLCSRGGVDPADVAVAALLETKESRWGEVVALFNGIHAFRTGGTSARDKASLGMLLDELVGYRNRVLGHGAPLAAEHYRRFGDLLGEAFSALLRQSPFLTARRLVSFGRPQVVEGSRIECAVVAYMGLQPMRSQTLLRLPYGAPAPREDALHLLSDDGAFLPIDPFLIAHAEDVYFLNEADGTPEYLSYATGERYRPSSVGERQQALFERILKYRVDSSRLVRIEEDCAAAPAAPEAPPAEGERRLGDYRIVREIGRGAMGAVFEAIQASLGRRVALKVLPGTFALDPKRVERFYREARATARVHHPSIVPVYEAGEAEGTHYYAMEFIDGPSLAQILAEAREAAERRAGSRGSSTGDPQYIANAVRRMAELADGIEEAHRLGLIHRDVKPSNILVDSGGRYILVDFGLVREEAAETLTRSGEMVGTLTYMSPEQVGRRRVDARADVYGLGATLYEILTLRVPFAGASEHEIQNAILFKEPVSPRKLNPRINRDLETIVLHALEKDPDRRYGSASQLAGDLRHLLRYEPIEARPRSTLAKIARRARRHIGVLAAAAAILALAAALGVVLWERQKAARRILEAEYGPMVQEAAIKILAAQGSTFDPGEWMLTPEFLQSAAGIEDALDDALARLREAAARIPDRPEAYLYMARAHNARGRHVQAMEALDEAIERQVDFVPAIVLRAALLERDGKADEARAELDRAEESAASGWPRLWLEADRAKDRGRWKQAEEAYGRLLDLLKGSESLYPGASLEAHLGRGLARLELGNASDAIQDFILAKDEAGRSIEPALLLGKAYCQNRQPKEAEKTFEDLYRECGRDQVAMAVSSIYMMLPHARNAHRWADRIQDEALRQEQRCRLLWWSGRWSEVVDEAEKGIEKDERSPRLQMYCGWSWSWGRRDLRRSEEHLAAAVKLAPEDALALASLAWVHLEQRRPDQALREAREAVKLNPENYLVRHLLGMVYLGMEDYDKAERTFLEAQRRDLQADASLEGLVWLYQRLGVPDEAIARVQAAIEEAPESAGLRAALGGLYRTRGDFEKAGEAFREAIRIKDAPVYFQRLGSTLKSLAHARRDRSLVEEAARAYFSAIERNPSFGDVHENLCSLFRDREPLQGMLEEVSASLRMLEEAWRDGRTDSPAALRTLALGWMLHPERPDREKALRYAHEAVEIGAGSDMDACLVLAEVQGLCDDAKGAIRTLEAALHLPGATADLREKARALRRAVFPDLPSFPSIDAVLAESDEDILIPEGAGWRYWKGLRGEPSPDLEWIHADFPEESWERGTTPMGYGVRRLATPIEGMAGTFSTLYARHRFSVTRRESIRRVLLSAWIDDGFVAYLNGREIRRVRAGRRGERLSSTAKATDSIIDAVQDDLWLDSGALLEGENCLAIQGLNVTPGSSDFMLLSVLRAERPADPDKDQELAVRIRDGLRGPDAADRRAYLEGRVFQRVGRFGEAAEVFAFLAGSERGSADRALVTLRQAECLRGAADPKEAARVLHDALRGPDFTNARDLWDLWLGISFVDLDRAPAEILSECASRDDYAGDVAWLLSQLRDGRGIRIDCGGEEHAGEDGAWGRDRFSIGGGQDDECFDEIEGTEDDRVYQSNRWFPDNSLEPPGYRIPLPRGTYDVILHICEFRLREKGERVFDAYLEGKKVLDGYDGLARVKFAEADIPVRERIRIEDGCLDIRFAHIIENPHIAGIEIRPVP